MKLDLITITALLAGVAVAYPQISVSENTGVNTNSESNNNSGVNTNSESNNNSGVNTNLENNNNSGVNTNSEPNNNSGINTNTGSNNNPESNTNTGSNTNSGINTNGNNGGSNVAAPQDGNNDSNQTPAVDAATAALMITAVNAWMRDTGVVSNFLNGAASYTDDQTFRNQAQIAHSAEVDELTHKAVLDQFMPNNANVQAANATLTNGAFQLVVDELQRMTDQGRAAMDGVDNINNDRCVNVLPNIDMYLKEAALTAGNGQSTVQSVRPAACSNIRAGVNGALQVGQPPPGYVNGKLPNGPAYRQQQNGGQNNNQQAENQNQIQNNNNNGNGLEVA